MTKVIIHAGLPKTATSFLQEKVFPYLSKDECLFNPHELNRILIELCKEVQSGCDVDRARIAIIKKEIDHEIEQIHAPVLLLSVEGLMPLHCGGYKSTEIILNILKQCLPDAEIVVFLREQLAWFRSAYSFCLVSKYVLPFDDFVSRDNHNQLGQRTHEGLGVCVFDYDYAKIRQTVEYYFSKTHFFNFEDLFSEQQNQSLQRLASILNVPSLKVGSSGPVNKGLDEGLMLIISKVTSYIPFRDSWKPEYLYTKYSKIGKLKKLKYFYLRKSGQLAVVVAKALHRLNPSAKSHLFTEQETKQILDYYRQSNAAFWTQSIDESRDT